ncbi:CBS domain-containing protein [Candidatus Saccharibacteria bacterium]|nr:CBS domain-containing protein [Candidatus Saccharibacteria bacterium]
MGAFKNWLEKWVGDENSEIIGAPSGPPRKSEDFVVSSLEELILILKNAPSGVLDSNDKKLLGAAMSFPERKVAEAMIPAEKVPLVYETDYLGPLMLDKLYKSGFSRFPVVDKMKRIVGVLSTEKLNSLEIKETDKAKKFVEKNVCYVRPDYLLSEALAAILRTEQSLLFVIDVEGRFLGVLTLAKIIEKMMGFLPQDEFVNDSSAEAVAKRKFE